MDKKLIALLNDNFDRYEVYMYKSFKVKKNRLIEVEAMIRSVVGNEPDYVKIPYEEHSRIELHLLLDERRSLLNWMFKETPEEWERMKVVNSRLLELTRELCLKMANVCDGLAKRKMLLMMIMRSVELCVLVIMTRILSFHTKVQKYMVVTIG